MAPTWEWIEWALYVAIVIRVVIEAVRSDHRRARSDTSLTRIGDGDWGDDAGCDSDGGDFGGGD